MTIAEKAGREDNEHIAYLRKVMGPLLRNNEEARAMLTAICASPAAQMFAAHYSNQGHSHEPSN